MAWIFSDGTLPKNIWCCLTKYKYQKQPSKRNWASAPSFNAYQIQTAVDIAIGDEGMRGNQTIEILEDERKRAYGIKPFKGVDV